MQLDLQDLNLVTILQVCDGIFDCPRSETSDDGEDEDDCYGGSWLIKNIAKGTTDPRIEFI